MTNFLITETGEGFLLLLRNLLKTEKISKTNIQRLYGNILKTSVSRLEQYRKCPFSFHLKYGLKLKEQEEYKDGYKYYSNLENTALFRKTSDDICDEFGLKVLDEKNCKSGINFENFYRKSLKNSDYYNFAKEDLDYAIKNSYSKKEFEQMLILFHDHLLLQLYSKH